MRTHFFKDNANVSKSGLRFDS